MKEDTAIITTASVTQNVQQGNSSTHPVHVVRHRILLMALQGNGPVTNNHNISLVRLNPLTTLKGF